jgi:hypothetical protein
MTAPAPTFRRIRLRTLRAAAALAVLSLGVAACDGDEAEDEPEISSIRLTVRPAGGAEQTYTLRESATASQTVVFRTGTNTVTAVALDDNNQAIDLGSDFELRIVQSVTLAAGSGNEVVTPLTGTVTFTASGTTANATVAATAANATARDAVARMFHRGEGHSDFDANFRFTVSAP